MDTDRERYLKQQIELGGAEVILTRPLGEVMRASPIDRPVSAPAPDPSAPGPAEEMRLPKWKQGAPPIPGPGLMVAPPVPSLLEGGSTAGESLESIQETVRGCTRCFLHQGRTNTVPGEGNSKARLMFVGEGPGQTEDQTGRPFVGRAGELLTGIISAIDLRREDVFIANVVKCRPPQNRKPLPDEMAACYPYLQRQIELIRPAVLVALGATAAEALLASRRGLGELRGKVHSYHGIPLIVTYHPAALLRNPNWKKPTWDDIRIARQLLDR